MSYPVMSYLALTFGFVGALQIFIIAVAWLRGELVLGHLVNVFIAAFMFGIAWGCERNSGW